MTQHTTPPAENGSILDDVPYNIEAEQQVLGSILMNNDLADRIAEIIQGGHFFEDVHRRLFESMMVRISSQQKATPVTLKTQFEKDPALAEVGGGYEYLVRLAGAAVGTALAIDYARTIRDLAILRNLIHIGQDMVATAVSPNVELTPAKQIEKAEGVLFKLAEQGTAQQGFVSFQEAMARAIDVANAAHARGDRLAGTSTGMRDLDTKLGGLHNSDLIILAGRPGMGKTSLATNIAFNISKTYRSEITEDGKTKVLDGAVVGFFSLEMSAEQLANRILSEQAEIPSHRIREGRLDRDEFSRLTIAAQEIEQVPLFIDETGAIPMSTLAARARRLKRQHNLGLIIVDYLQLLKPPVGARTDNRVQELSEITMGLKALAKELHVPVIALSQLSRQVESRDDKRPQLSDLRESGSIEQDADVVMFVFREEYYLREPLPEDEVAYSTWQANMERCYGKAEVIIGKQRHGPTGTVMLQFQKEFTRFGDLAEEDRLPKGYE